LSFAVRKRKKEYIYSKLYYRVLYHIVAESVTKDGIYQVLWSKHLISIQYDTIR